MARISMTDDDDDIARVLTMRLRRRDRELTVSKDDVALRGASDLRTPVDPAVDLAVQAALIPQVDER
jgi:hypothetical protein